MQRRGIELPIRSKNAGKEPVNKGTSKKYYCLNCGKDITNALLINTVLINVNVSINNGFNNIKKIIL